MNPNEGILKTGQWGGEGNVGLTSTTIEKGSPRVVARGKDKQKYKGKSWQAPRGFAVKKNKIGFKKQGKGSTARIKKRAAQNASPRKRRGKKGECRQTRG